MLPAGFEPAVSASERPQTHALGHAATGIDLRTFTVRMFMVKVQEMTVWLYKSDFLIRNNTFAARKLRWPVKH